jgi:hypothetical protein
MERYCQVSHVTDWIEFIENPWHVFCLRLRNNILCMQNEYEYEPITWPWVSMLLNILSASLSWNLGRYFVFAEDVEYWIAK